MIRQKLDQLGLVIPKLTAAFGAYVPARRHGDLIFIAGQLPMKDGQMLASGPVPGKTSIEQAQLAARQCVINALAAVETLPGGLDELVGVVRIGVFVQSDDGFDAQPKVANAASELLIELFGDKGKHARAAVGTNALPLNASVEIEFLFEAR
jgi:enamine deaminase RidA (YjgF/YER057c/UK114 family)